LLIFIPKCIELNSKSGSRWVLRLGLGPNPSLGLRKKLCDTNPVGGKNGKYFCRNLLVIKGYMYKYLESWVWTQIQTRKKPKPNRLIMQKLKIIIFI
jgi:hypothetical protein